MLHVTRGLLFASFAWLLLPQSISAAVLTVDWEGNYFTNGNATMVGINVTGTSVDTGNTRTWVYSTTQTKNSQSGIYNTAQTSALFYGALAQTTATGAANFNANTLNNNSGSNYLLLRGPNTASTNIQGLLFWKKEDFLNGQGAGAVSFDAGSSLSIGITSFVGDTRNLRYTVLNDGQWYISQTNSLVSGTLNNLPTSLWAAWDPTGNTIAPIPSAINYTVAGSSFTDIEGIGFFFSVTSANAQPRLEWNGFSASLAPVPEANALSLLLIPGSLVFLVKRWRTRVRS